ncbi:hypothetical protein B0H14DRAFT_2355388, partial [Mycena olivaceomarginata]
LYNKLSYYKALDLWEEAAKAAGCTKAELAYRWVVFASAVSKRRNAVIFGATENSQMASLKRGAVGEAAKAKINEIWKIVEQDAPLDNYNQ